MSITNPELDSIDSIESVRAMLDALELVRADVTAEYLRGSFYVNSAASGFHGRAVFELAHRLRPVVPKGYSIDGNIRVRFGDGSVRVPDLVVARRVAVIQVTGDNELPIDDVLLIIEVLSPSTAHLDRGIKKDLCRLSEVDYWLVTPATDEEHDWSGIEIHPFGGGVVSAPG